ncbi:MAG TPA: hypothetical protein VFZ95_01360 [Steroidobacteraceae bacterium]
MNTRTAVEPTPEAQLKAFIGRFDSKNQKLIRSVRTALRKRFPAANELVYDYSSSVVIGYSPTQGGIDSVVAIAGRADGVSLYFNEGQQLPDPKGLLLGSGKQTRFIPVETSRRLAHPDVKALIAAAVDLAKVPMPSKGKGALIIRSSAAKKKARAKSKK